MDNKSIPEPLAHTRSDASAVSQTKAEQQVQYFTRLAQTDPAAFAQVVQNSVQQHGSGVSAILTAYSAKNRGSPDSDPIGDFRGVAPHADYMTYSQPYKRLAGAPAADTNTFFGMNIAAELSRLNYTSSIPPSRDLDVVVASRLQQADRDGKSYKDALREMHAVFNYPSNLWIDYYLDRRVSIHDLIDDYERSTPAITAKNPGSDSTASAMASASIPAARSDPAPVKKEKEANGDLQAGKLRRVTLNSTAAFYESTPESKDVPMPDPPSREPTPPTEVQSMGLRGNAFTEADVKYLVKFVNWVCAHKDWSVTKMYKKLYKKAPHHSAASWASKAKTIPIIAKIIDASAQDEDEEEEEEEDENYQEMDVDGTADVERSSSGRERKRVGGNGTAITEDDLKNMADWIVENGDTWKEMSGKMRWLPFAEKYDKRSWSAWTVVYRRYQADVDAHAKKRRRAQASGPSDGKRPRND